jgi:hypothetical protein
MIAPSGRVQYGTNWMRQTLQARQARDRMLKNPREELRSYLESPLECVDNVIAWWGVSDITLLADTPC